jgi:hypothetical protein
MNKFMNYYVTAIGLSLCFAAAAAAPVFGQTGGSKTAGSTATPTISAANTQTVDARQSGDWTVGIDWIRNTVKLQNSPADPLPVKVIGSGSARKAFQARVSVNVTPGSGFQTQFLPIPAGKRLVIENISAVGRVPAGGRMEIRLDSYLDNNGDGVGDLSDIVFHRIALIDQGTFDDMTVLTANHNVLIFADEQIGTSHFGVGVSVRMNGVSGTVQGQGQVTVSGYLEDLSAVQ